MFLTAAAVLTAVIAGAGASRAAKPVNSGPQQNLDRQFTTTVRPFLQTYCIACHGKEKPQAQLDLASYVNMQAAAADYPHLALMIERLEAKDMPPKEWAKHPSDAQYHAVVAWLKSFKKWEAERNAGDPGLVLARRLSNAEYDYTIRDLTGFDLKPTKEFPVDPANQEGFDNTGESLTVSPSLMKKYLQTARYIADHMVLNSTGIAFAPHPVLVETDRDKYSILRIVDFYKQQPTNLTDYFVASWRYKHRAALGQPNANLSTIASDSKVSAKYLDLIWKTLTDPTDKVGPIATLQAKFNALPTPASAKAEAPREEAEALKAWVTDLRAKVASKFPNLNLPGFSPGGQWNLLWKDRQYAQNRRKLNPVGLQIGGVPKPKRPVDPKKAREPKEPMPGDEEVNPDLFVPADEAARAPYLASFERFSSVFPDAFYIPDRGRMEFFDPNDKGRLLTAGFHNMMGYFRDDQPLMELILDDNGQKELNRLWTDFDAVANVQERMHLEFIFYERAEAHTITEHAFDFARSEDKDATTEVKIKRLADVYLAKARKNVGGDEAAAKSPAYQAMVDHFRLTNEHIRAIEKVRKASEPLHVNGVLDFARRAYRRPLTATEKADLLSFYKASREQSGLSHEDAVRDMVASVLMSPNFMYRVDLDENATPSVAPKPARKTRTISMAAPTPGQGGTVVKPLSDYALASRLSYFLWSSAPDDELLSLAAKGELKKPEVLVAQTRRMLKDARVKGIATEFGGNWLDFRRFEEHNGVDRERFPSYTDDLRTAMYQEPIRFLVNAFQQNASILDLLYGNYTFVNDDLAKHYGMDVKPKEGEWVRVDNAQRFGRGGILPMGLFLTNNASGLRTSPVKRGYWIVRKVLGEHIPPPPPTVAELPKDEKQLGERTLRQALEQHRQDPACGGCHARFDSFGLVFEGYGPVGEQRTKDMAGKAVEISAPFPGGDKAGLKGLQEFLRAKRQDDFLTTVTRKMLSYGLSRGLQASDEPLIAQLKEKLAGSNYGASTLIESVVTSKQFRYRRTAAELALN